jgi:membrane fusion protein, multidrug efflux system
MLGMKRWIERGFSLIAVALVVILMIWFGVGRGRPARADVSPPLAVPVTAGVAALRDMPVFVRGIGNVQAFNAVLVKSRVDGQIMQVHFTEGQEVKAGDPLFQIDSRPFQAALAQAEAARERDQALLRAAQLDLERYSRLVGPGWQTRQSYDNQKAAVEQLQGAIKGDEAQIETAKLNLTYADIRSPIAGRTGARLVDLGNLIQASQGTGLVSITQLKPIYVSFTVPQDHVDQLRQNQSREKEGGGLPVLAYASDDKTLLARGRLSLIDNQIDAATGTIRLKAVFDNADERLWPGEFVSARVVLSQRKDIVTVPAQTVMQGPNGAFLYVIKPDDTVEQRPVQLGSIQDGLAFLEKGLAAGERVVVEGQYRLTNGVRVKIDQPKQTESSG